MRMDIIKESLKLLEDLYIPENNLTELFERMIRKKKSLNDLLGITRDTDYRIVLPSSMTEDFFIDNFPRTYTLIKELCGDSEFSLTGNWIKCPTKRKLSKYINKIINSRYLSSNQLRYIYEELGISDVMSIFDIVKPKNVIISTNMYDFFSSSTGTPFRSCYNITGSHFNGNIAYMEDTFTFIIYTSTDDLNKKIGRTWGYLTKGSNMFLTSRLYGSIYSQEIKVAVDYIKSKFPEIDKWNDERIHYEHFHNAKPYADDMVPVYFDNEYITIYKPTGNGCDFPELHFKNITCLECGEPTNNGHYGRCSRCMENISRCEYCDKAFHIDTSSHSSVCKDCVEKHFKTCTMCGEKSYSLYDVDEGHICQCCLEQNYQSCLVCGKLIKSSSSELGYVCEECTHLVKTCDECGRKIILTSEVPFIHNGGIQCSRCGINRIAYIPFPEIIRNREQEASINGISLSQEWNYNDIAINAKSSGNLIRLYLNGNYILDIDLRSVVERLIGNEITVELIRNIILLYLLRDIGYMEVREYMTNSRSSRYSSFRYRDLSGIVSGDRIPRVDEELVARIPEEVNYVTDYIEPILETHTYRSYMHGDWGTEPILETCDIPYNDLELTDASRHRLEMELGLTESRERLEAEVAIPHSETRYVTTNGNDTGEYVISGINNHYFNLLDNIEESYAYTNQFYIPDLETTNVVGTNTNGIGTN
ncbi:MAG: hypothetical protein PHN69_03160 [Candidatus Pacebacteria bacterium]|nr:hypothetical protein [Candidatus Paceibacterota bacterium]